MRPHTAIHVRWHRNDGKAFIEALVDNTDHYRSVIREAELSGICRGASIALGLQSLAKDLGVELRIEILTDATAAIGICRRRGLGKIRHLHVSDLWIQDRLKTGDFKLTKVAGTDNPADILTKHVTRDILKRHMDMMGLCPEDGRATSAPTLEH